LSADSSPPGLRLLPGSVRTMDRTHATAPDLRFSLQVLSGWFDLLYQFCLSLRSRTRTSLCTARIRTADLTVSSAFCQLCFARFVGLRCIVCRCYALSARGWIYARRCGLCLCVRSWIAAGHSLVGFALRILRCCMDLLVWMQFAVDPLGLRVLCSFVLRTGSRRWFSSP